MHDVLVLMSLFSTSLEARSSAKKGSKCLSGSRGDWGCHHNDSKCWVSNATRVVGPFGSACLESQTSVLGRFIREMDCGEIYYVSSWRVCG